MITEYQYAMTKARLRAAELTEADIQVIAHGMLEFLVGYHEKVYPVPPHLMRAALQDQLIFLPSEDD